MATPFSRMLRNSHRIGSLSMKTMSNCCKSLFDLFVLVLAMTNIVVLELTYCVNFLRDTGKDVTIKIKQRKDPPSNPCQSQYSLMPFQLFLKLKWHQ